MRDFAKAKPSERQVLWAKIKKEQADLIAEAREQYRTSKSSGSKDSAEGDLRRTGDTSIATIWQRVRPIYTGDRVRFTEAVRPPTPPPPHAGLKPKVAPKKRSESDERSWIEKAGDARNLLKVQVSGDRCETPPTLVPNPSSAAPFDDKTKDHHWDVYLR